MEKIERAATPPWLTEKWQEWGETWQRKHEQGEDFKWYQHKNNSYDELVNDLSAMTQHHCSFCDAYPMGGLISNTIEHFRPKSQFPLLAYQWENLFICCGNCQKKGAQFDEILLKPDEITYAFDDYFNIEWDTGKLIANRMATPENKDRANLTIELYQLNKNSKPESRLEELNKFLDSNHPEINQFSYRFFLKRGV